MALTIQTFEDLLRTTEPELIVRDSLLTASPYVFQKEPDHSGLLKNLLASRLHVTVDDIAVMGSALTGFSLNPNNYPRPLSDRSDIDVIVISQTMFDEAWGTVLKWHYPRRGQHLQDRDRIWMTERRREVYWGWFVPSRIKYRGITLPASLIPLRDLSARWFNAFQELGTRREFAARTVSGRLYRTWDHVVMYHANGLRRIKAQLHL